jgi:hypothetical protein
METTFEVKSQSLVEKREHVGHCGNKNHTWFISDHYRRIKLYRTTVQTIEKQAIVNEG